MKLSLPGKSYRGDFLPLTATEILWTEQLYNVVLILSEEIGERNLRRFDALQEASRWIEKYFTKLDGHFSKQIYQIENKDCENLILEYTGQTYPDQIVVIGAHYDSVLHCPGANDNASGIAALLVLASLFAKKETEKTLRFVAFTNEEPPHFQSEKMGSFRYARECRRRGEKIKAMVCFDTIGYFSQERGSQHYPPPMGMYYPEKGNFIGFVSNLKSKNLLCKMIKTFRKTTDFPSEGACLPAWVPGVGWSDHWSFWQFDYDGILITDTAPYRYPCYHTEKDTIELLNFQAMARIVSGISCCISDLAGEQ